MTISNPVKASYFTRAFSAIAILGPILLVIIAGTLPEGRSIRGDLIVDGHIFIVAALATALVLRAVYGMGFNNALKNARERLASSANRPLTA